MVAAKTRVAGAWVDSSIVAKVRVGGAWVDYGPASIGPETFFANRVPASRDLTDSYITVGLRFTPSVAGKLTKYRFRYPINNPSATIPIKVGLYLNSSVTLLESADFPLYPSVTLDAWNELASPTSGGYSLAAGVAYTVTALTPRYTADGAFPWPATSTGGSLVTDSVNAGRYTVGTSLTYPTSFFNASNYNIDLVFQAA